MAKSEGKTNRRRAALLGEAGLQEQRGCAPCLPEQWGAEEEGLRFILSLAPHFSKPSVVREGRAAHAPPAVGGIAGSTSALRPVPPVALLEGDLWSEGLKLPLLEIPPGCSGLAAHISPMLRANPSASGTKCIKTSSICSSYYWIVWNSS